MPRIDHPVLQGLLFRSVALLAMGVLAHLPLASAAGNIKVCHRPPDNPSNVQILWLPPSAVADHLAHGDNLVEPEVCDGEDNDCDGEVDEDLGEFGTCVEAPGTLCEGQGVLVCRLGEKFCTAVRLPPQETTEITCGDGEDNDCDSLTDRDDPDCTAACHSRCDAEHTACVAGCKRSTDACLAQCAGSADCEHSCSRGSVDCDRGCGNFAFDCHRGC